jgi:type II secretory pathway pseudopilin PulG
MIKQRSRHGFTLFEVAVSIALVGLGVLVLALFLPTAIKAQEKARFQLYADAKAMEVMEYFSSQPQINIGINNHLEASNPWDIPTGYRAYAPDIEPRTAAVRGPLFVLPTDIARRLDSPNDEIRRILDEGGQLYYSNPAAANNGRMDAPYEPQPPNEAIRLVIGFRGHPQQNALAQIPWKGWPYYANYPGPPGFWKGGLREFQVDDDAKRLWSLNYDGAYPTGLAKSGAWDWDGAIGAGIKNYLNNGNGLTEYKDASGKYSLADGWLAAKSQYVLALWYAWRKGLPDALLFGQATQADIDLAYRNTEWVRAMRFLAYSAICMTKYYALEPEALRPEQNLASIKPNQYYPPAKPGYIGAVPEREGLRTGVPVPGEEDPSVTNGRDVPSPITLDELMSILPVGVGGDPFSPARLPAAPAGVATPLAGHLYLTHAMIVNYHETCLSMAMRYTAEEPYDWSLQRPFQRAIMMDHPLLQYDLINAPLSGAIAGVAADTRIDASVKALAANAQQWRPIAAMDITNPGLDSVNQAVPWSTIHGDPRYFNLCDRFSGNERAREMVFWEVDWTAYKDFETATSAPIDASRYPRIRPESISNGKFTRDYMGVRFSEKAKWDNWTTFWYEAYEMNSRNPEKNRLFIKSMSDVPTGTNILWWRVPPDNSHDQSQEEAGYFRHGSGIEYMDSADRGYDRTRATYPDGNPVPDPRTVFSGLYGADRNGNQLLDRGKLPPSVRMVAREVARFVVYDPRLAMTVR